MNTSQTTKGIALMIAATIFFSVQDGLSRYLAGSYNTVMVVTIRYWFFAGFVILLALRRRGGIRAVATAQPGLHLLRAVFLIAEVSIIIRAYTLIGLVETHAVFAICPILIAALAGPFLGERLGLWRWLAVGSGFAGVLVILAPGAGVFSVAALLPLLSALLYAAYSLLTRKAAALDDSMVSLFWSGVIGAVMLTPIGVYYWQPMSAPDWVLMVGYGLIVTIANWLIIRCYQVAEASAVQPFAYLQLVFASLIGILFFGETLRLTALIGAGIVVAAGLMTILHSHRGARPAGDAT